MKNYKPLSTEDEKLIENVERYISDHYSSNIPQSLLEKIACMSGTKLKESFNKKKQLEYYRIYPKKKNEYSRTAIVKYGPRN